MEENIKGNGKKGKKMDMEYFLGQLEWNIMGSIKMITAMAMVYLNNLMGAFMKDNGQETLVIRNLVIMQLMEKGMGRE